MKKYLEAIKLIKLYEEKNPENKGKYHAFCNKDVFVTSNDDYTIYLEIQKLS